MTKYHKTKEEALASGSHLTDYWFTRAELEPYNGWTLVLNPKTKDVFNYPLGDLLDIAELDLGRVAVRPEGYKRPPSLSAVQARNKAVKPPPPPPQAPKPPVAANTKAVTVAKLPPPPPPPTR